MFCQIHLIPTEQQKLARCLLHFVPDDFHVKEKAHLPWSRLIYFCFTSTNMIKDIKRSSAELFLYSWNKPLLIIIEVCVHGYTYIFLSVLLDPFVNTFLGFLFQIQFFLGLNVINIDFINVI